VDYFEQLPEGK